MHSPGHIEAILSAAPDAIVTVNGDDEIVGWNGAAETLFGYRWQEAAGQRAADLIVPSYLREQYQRGLQRFKEGGLRVSRLEMPGQRRDGSEFPCELSISASNSDSGEKLYTAFVRDISERHDARAEIAKRLQLELFLRDQTEEANEKLHYLAEASALLASSLDYQEAVQAVARLAVPRLADWCAVDLFDTRGDLQRVAITHIDPEKQQLAEDYQQQVGANEDSAALRVASSGEPILVAEIPDEMLVEALADTNPTLLELVRQLGIHSTLCVPVVGREQVIGALTFVWAETEKTYQEKDLELAADLGRRIGMTIENAVLYARQRQLAYRLQRTLLPESLPLLHGASIAARYRPGESEIGGDFLDLFSLDERSWFLIVGDVCGKGVEAASSTGLARHTLRTAALLGCSPAEALAHLNRAIGDADATFATVACARLEQQEQGLLVTAASGGHPSPLITRRSGESLALTESGPAIGLFPDADWPEQQIELQNGDLMILYTDGVSEAKRQGELFGEERIRELMASVVDEDGLAASSLIDHAAAAFAEDGRPVDDIAIVALKVDSREPSFAAMITVADTHPDRIGLTLTPEASSAGLRAVRQLSSGLPGPLGGRLYHLISELLLAHSGSQQVSLTVEFESGQVRVECRSELSGQLTERIGSLADGSGQAEDHCWFELRTPLLAVALQAADL